MNLTSRVSPEKKHSPCSKRTEHSFPRTILIVGTDASGKDHIANIIEKSLHESGQATERRKRFLCGKITRERSSTGKNSLELFGERCFLFLFPWFSALFTRAIIWILEKDLRNYLSGEKTVIVVGHNCLRGLAFLWGTAYEKFEEVPIPPRLIRLLDKMRSIPDLCTFVLDVEDDLRKKRIVQREQSGEIDHFDRYMAADGNRSEQIERFLVHLTRTYLDGHLIENNDLSEQEIQEIFFESIRQ
jgi:thymidylate kinase